MKIPIHYADVEALRNVVHHMTDCELLRFGMLAKYYCNYATPRQRQYAEHWRLARFEWRNRFRSGVLTHSI